MARPVILDTDIGSDIDDLLALLFVLGSPELELVGISTAYGDTTLRARIADRILRWSNAEVPIMAGVTEPLSGRPVWYAGYEASQAKSISVSSRFKPVPAAEFFASVVKPNHGKLAILAIAPLTNLASAPLIDGMVDGAFSHVTIMGGDFGRGKPAEHNVISDTVGAARVLATPTPKTLIGKDQTLRVRLRRERIHAATSGRSPLAQFARREVDRWMGRNMTDYVLVHDPLAAATLTHPDNFDSVSGSVEVVLSGDEVGTTIFTPNEHGTTNVIVDFDPIELGGLILDRIRFGLGRGG